MTVINLPKGQRRDKCDLSNVRYVNIIKVALFRMGLCKVTGDPFIKVSSDCVSMLAAASLS